MENIEIGEYVRTKNGYILKNTIKEHKHIIDGIINQNEKYKYEFDNIEKHSKNIINLIEVGDYVNGERVLQTNCKLEYIDDDTETGVDEVYDGLELQTSWIYFESDIKSILTKEQFKNSCYRLEE